MVDEKSSFHSSNSGSPLHTASLPVTRNPIARVTCVTTIPNGLVLEL